MLRYDAVASELAVVCSPPVSRARCFSSLAVEISLDVVTLCRDTDGLLGNRQEYAGKQKDARRKVVCQRG